MQFQIKDRYVDEILVTVDIDAEEETSRSDKLGLAVAAAQEVRANLRRADLSLANLEKADLGDAYLADTDLTSANLRYAWLFQANLEKADLTFANLNHARLNHANLTLADLREANLQKADLTFANLQSANLSGADLRGASLDNVYLACASLYGADMRGALIRDATLRWFKADYWMVLTENFTVVPGLIAALSDGRIFADSVDYAKFEDRRKGSCGLVKTIASIRGVGVQMFDRSPHRPAEQWFSMLRNGHRPGDETAAGYAARMAIEWAIEWCSLSGVNPSEAPKS
jgi:hypothetical protein